jgi:hypothetical protein
MHSREPCRVLAARARAGGAGTRERPPSRRRAGRPHSRGRVWARCGRLACVRAPRSRPHHRGRPLAEDDRDGPDAKPRVGGRARFVTARIEDADLGDETYDRVFAVHVSALHGPGRPLEVVRERLAPGGRLYLFSQAPGWKRPRHAERFGAELAATLGRAGFPVEEVLVETVGNGFVSGVIARGSR